MSRPPAVEAAAQVSAIVTAFARLEPLRETLARLTQCRPPPAEILVHVDGGRSNMAAVVRTEFPAVRLFQSEDRLGPGGARNLLIRAAVCPWVASFDDDSRPLDDDFFARVERVMELFPQADLVAAKIYIRGQTAAPASPAAEWVSDFVGCGCVYRRDSFLRTTGYVPLPLAYGMEEVDLAVRMHATGQQILESGELRVLHDTDYHHHGDKQVTSAGIVNSALHAYLRYPVVLWPLGLLQFANRLWWLIRHGRIRGIFHGIIHIPAHLWHYRNHRNPIAAGQLRKYRRQRHQSPAAAAWPDGA